MKNKKIIIACIIIALLGLVADIVSFLGKENTKLKRLSHRIEDIKRNQMDILELINIITEIKRLVDGLRIRNEIGKIITDSPVINRTIKE